MNFNKTILYGLMLNLLLIAQPASAMLRRIAPQVASTLAASTLIAQKRTLLPGQENHPLWIKANQDLEDFRKKHSIPEPNADRIKTARLMNFARLSGVFLKEINLDSNISLAAYRQSLGSPSKERLCLVHCLTQSYEHKDFTTFFKIYNEINPPKNGASTASTATNNKELFTRLEQEIKPILTKHAIDPNSIRIIFDLTLEKHGINYKSPDSVATTNGIDLTLYVRYLTLSKEERQAIIEHEICHIIMNDCYTKRQDKDIDVIQTDTLLLERRADIHTAIQSIENANTLKNGIGYVERYMEYHKKNYPNSRSDGDYIKKALDYHKKHADQKAQSTAEDSIIFGESPTIQHTDLTTIDPKESTQKTTSHQKKAAALIGATAAGTYLYKKHQENKDSVLRIQKSWHGFKPLGNTIWQAIEEKTNNRITRKTHTYSIVDCKTDWEITFAAK